MIDISFITSFLDRLMMANNNRELKLDCLIKMVQTVGSNIDRNHKVIL